MAPVLKYFVLSKFSDGPRQYICSNNAFNKDRLERAFTSNMSDSSDARGVSPKTERTFTNKWFFACVLPLFFLVPAMIPGVYWREVKVNMNPSVYTAKSDMLNIHIEGSINLTKKDSVSEIQDIPIMKMVDKKSPIFSKDTPQYGDYFPKKLQKMSQVGKTFLPVSYTHLTLPTKRIV